MNFKKAVELIRNWKEEFNLDLELKAKSNGVEYELRMEDGKFIVTHYDLTHYQDDPTSHVFYDPNELCSRWYNLYRSLDWPVVDPIEVLDNIYKKYCAIKELSCELNEAAFDGGVDNILTDGLYQKLEDAISEAYTIAKSTGETLFLIEDTPGRPHYSIRIEPGPVDDEDVLHLGVSTWNKEEDISPITYDPDTGNIVTSSDHAGIRNVQYWRLCDELTALSYF